MLQSMKLHTAPVPINPAASPICQLQADMEAAVLAALGAVADCTTKSQTAVSLKW